MIQKALTGAPAIGEPLALADVDGAPERLAEEQGAGSTERRVEALRRLFGRATPEERRFLSQLLVGEIRQGALEGVLLDAIAKAAHLPPADVRQASMFAPDIGALARVALEEDRPGSAASR